MKAQISILVKLQEIEDQISEVSVRLDAVAGKVRELQARCEAETAEIGEEQSRLAALKEECKEKEATLEANYAKLEKSREKQRAVKTNEAFQAITREIDEIKKKSKQLEEELSGKKSNKLEKKQSGKGNNPTELGLMGEVEAAEADISKKTAAYERRMRDLEAEIARVQKEAEADEQALIRLQEQQQAMARDLPPELWNRFELIKRKAGGIAIARVSDGVCEGCDMNLPPQLYNELQRLDSLRFCPHCQRMIYWEAPQPEPEAMEG